MSFEQELAREPAGQTKLPLTVPEATRPRPLLLRHTLPTAEPLRSLSPLLSPSPKPPGFLQVKINFKKTDFKINTVVWHPR